MNTRTITGAVLAVLILTGCTATGSYPNQGASNSVGTKQIFGTILGGAGGGYLGSQFGSGKGKTAATIVGALLGAAAGSSVGASLDRADQLAHQQAQQTSLNNAPDGVPVTWQNPNQGTAGQVVPTRTFQSGNTYCREFQQTIQVGGQVERGYGRACLQPDGSWQIQ